MSSAPAGSKEASSPEVRRPGDSPLPASRYLLFLGVAVVGAACDLISKQWVFHELGLPDASRDNTVWLWEGYVGIQTAVNQGALFGLGRGYGFLFVALSLVAAVGIPYWLFVRRAGHDRLLTLSLACVTGGIFGNLYDRLGVWHSSDIAPYFRNGVRDWILLQFHQYRWPNFNIADSLLVCGAALLMWHLYLHQELSPQTDPPAKADAKSRSEG